MLLGQYAGLLDPVQNIGKQGADIRHQAPAHATGNPPTECGGFTNRRSRMENRASPPQRPTQAPWSVRMSQASWHRARVACSSMGTVAFPPAWRKERTANPPPSYCWALSMAAQLSSQRAPRKGVWAWLVYPLRSAWWNNPYRGILYPPSTWALTQTKD